MAWQIDPYHLQVEFAVKHFGMMTVRGHFGDVSATGQIDPQNPAASSVEVTIKTDSIKTNNPQRDLDLRSSNFLGIEEFPTITFKSTKIEPAGDDEYKMTGDLTIKGITRPVTLKVKRYGEINDERMGHRVAYGAETVGGWRRSENRHRAGTCRAEAGSGGHRVAASSVGARRIGRGLRYRPQDEQCVRQRSRQKQTAGHGRQRGLARKVKRCDGGVLD